MWEDREEEVSCLRKENLGQSCIELRIPHADGRMDGQTLIARGGGSAKNADKDLGVSLVAGCRFS